MLETCADGVVMRGSVEDLPCLARILASLPFEFAICEPVAMRQALRDHAAHLLRLADG